MKSVLILSRSIPLHGVGGTESVTWDLARSWAGTGLDVTIVTTRLPSREDPFEADGVSVVPLDETVPGSPSGGWWRASKLLWRFLEIAPDVVFSVGNAGNAVAKRRDRHRRTAFINQACTTTATEIAARLRSGNPGAILGTAGAIASWPRDLLSYRRFDRIVAGGQEVYDSLTSPPQSWAVEERAVALVPNGVRAEDFSYRHEARQALRRQLGIKQTDWVAGSFVPLDPQRRVDLALRAIAQLREDGDRDVRLLIVGDGPDQQRLHALTRQLGITQTVIFAGAIDRKALSSYYAATDVALLATAGDDGYPIPMLEALACGVPCVVPPSLRPLGPFGEDAVRRADPRDTGALAGILAHAATRDGARQSLLPASLTIEHSADAYLEIFEEATSRRTRAAVS